MPDRIKLAFIGCGGITAAHLDQGLKQFPDVAFVGWCDPSEDHALARRAQVGGHGEIFNDPDRMIGATRPDAVYVMLPPFAHGEAEEAMLAHRLPFFIEKPVDLDLARAERTLKAVKSKRLITAVGYMNRYRYGVRRVREMLADRSRRLVLMHGGWIASMCPEKYFWLVEKKQSGGQVVEQSTHTLDLMRHFGGDVVSVSAVPVTGRLRRPRWYTAEDASLVTLTFRNGAAATLYSSWATPHGDVSLEVHATDFGACFREWAHHCTIRHGREEISIAAEPDIFGIEDRAFIDAVRTGDRSGIEADYADGVATLRVALAANRSMKTGRVVKF